MYFLKIVTWLYTWKLFLSGNFAGAGIDELLREDDRVELFIGDGINANPVSFSRESAEQHSPEAFEEIAYRHFLGSRNNISAVLLCDSGIARHLGSVGNQPVEVLFDFLGEWPHIENLLTTLTVVKHLHIVHKHFSSCRTYNVGLCQWNTASIFPHHI